MERGRGKRYPVRSEDYQLFEEIGEGVSASVYRARCIPFNETVAIKVLDLEKCNNDFEGIRREVKTMFLIDHPNVLRAHCSFATDQSLWVVMPYMAQGSCLHIMKSAYPEGFEEVVIITILRDVLRALVYLHGHGHIHRDVKAGNILIDSNGAVKLADFGVSACMFDTGDRQRSRNTFVGTPCWMAPEVMQQLHGYDFKADIWSFGITALELAHGHAPFSKYPPMKVLLMTLQNAPPGLDYERDKKFSKSFKQMVATCLVKDPKKRPTAEKLLKHKAFKTARSNEYLMRTILEGLPPLGDRFRKLKAQEADYLLQNKGAYEEHLSQQEYIRGISGWNFNVEDLRAQAALLDDNMEFPTREDPEMNGGSKNGFKDAAFAMEALNSMTVNGRNVLITEDGLHEIENFEDSLASFPSHPLQALKGCFDVSDYEASASSNDLKDTVHSSSEHVILQQSPEGEELEHTNNTNTDLERTMRKNIVPAQQKFFSGSLLPEQVASQSGNSSGNGNREGQKNKYPSDRNYSGPLMSSQAQEPLPPASSSIPEETSEGRVVQRKGRFKVTSADAINKCPPSANCMNNLTTGSSAKTTVTSSSVLPTLQFILQQNATQKDQLAKLIKSVEQTAGSQSESADFGSGESTQSVSASGREKQLQSYVVQLQQRIGYLSEEIQKLKVTNAQLQRQLDAVSCKDEERALGEKRSKS